PAVLLRPACQSPSAGTRCALDRRSRVGTQIASLICSHPIATVDFATLCGVREQRSHKESLTKFLPGVILVRGVPARLASPGSLKRAIPTPTYRLGRGSTLSHGPYGKDAI